MTLLFPRTIDARATWQEDDTIHLELTSNDKTVNMTARAGMTLEELAELAINQKLPGDVDRTFQQRYVIGFYIEEYIDPETGAVSTYRVVDSVTPAQLPDEAARDGYANLPGWADWTAEEAEAWIEANVTDLPTAKNVLIQMARAITYLRDWRK